MTNVASWIERLDSTQGTKGSIIGANAGGSQQVIGSKDAGGAVPSFADVIASVSFEAGDESGKKIWLQEARALREAGVLGPACTVDRLKTITASNALNSKHVVGSSGRESIAALNKVQKYLQTVDKSLKH